jgi:Cu/Ag efflux protein CusF
MMMKARPMSRTSILAVCLSLGLAACAAKENEAPAPPPPAPAAAAAPAALPSGTVGANLVSATAKVKAINHKTRMVTLQRDDGSTITFRASKEVRNLGQVKVGDVVNVSYYESLAYEVKKPGDATPGASVAEGLQRAPAGAMPGGSAARVTTITATIEAIDKAAGTITLRGPGGKEKTIKARDPRNLDRVSVGDLVQISYTEAIGISVQEQPKKKKK